MADVVFVLIVVAFFVVAALYVRACAGIVSVDAVEPTSEVDEDEVAV